MTKKIVTVGALALMLVLSGCTSSGRTSSPSCDAQCQSNLAAANGSTVASSPSLGSLADQEFLGAMQGLPGINASDADLIQMGKAVCSALRAGSSVTDAVDGVTSAPADRNLIALIVQPSAKSYCPEQVARVDRGVAALDSPAPAPAPRPTTKARPTPVPRVTLRVTGNGSHALVTYSEGTSIEQDTNGALPWSKRISPNYDFYQVSGQDKDGTSITCEIIGADGSVLDKHTSHGQYAVVSCSSSG